MKRIHILTLFVILLISLIGGYFYAKIKEEDAKYQIKPEESDKDGEYLVYFFVSQSCSACKDERLPTVIENIKHKMRNIVEINKQGLKIIGVGLDYDINDSFKNISNFGNFDEVIIGRKWLNSAAIEHIWNTHSTPTIPQIVVVKRNINLGFLDQKNLNVGQLNISNQKYVLRLIGIGQMYQWLNKPSL